MRPRIEHAGRIEAALHRALAERASAGGLRLEHRRRLRARIARRRISVAWPLASARDAARMALGGVAAARAQPDQAAAPVVVRCAPSCARIPSIAGPAPAARRCATISRQQCARHRPRAHDVGADRLPRLPARRRVRTSSSDGRGFGRSALPVRRRNARSDGRPTDRAFEPHRRRRRAWVGSTPAAACGGAGDARTARLHAPRHGGMARCVVEPAAGPAVLRLAARQDLQRDLGQRPPACRRSRRAASAGRSR